MSDLINRSSSFNSYKIIGSRTNRTMFFLCSIVLFSIQNIDNFCTGLMSTRRSSGRVISERFSLINIKRPYNPSNRNILFANARNIDIGFGSNNVFAKELLRHNLLSASDECDLSKHYKLGSHVKAQRKQMIKELGREVSDFEIAQTLDIPEDQVSQIVEKGEAAKALLVRANMRLVFHIARYYKFRGVAYPDLVQEGTFGLIKAVDKYDPERGFRFSTYASWWIKQSVSRSIAEKSRIIRLPVHIHDMMVSIAKVEKQFIGQHGRKPNSVELSERLALPIQKVELLVKCSREVRSIDEDVYQMKNQVAGNSVQVKDRIVSDQTEPSLLNERNSLRSELRNAMQNLSEREAQIVEMRFGLLNGSPMTLEEIGKQFNVTRERIRQIEARAMSKLRSPLKTSELKEIFQDHSLVNSASTINNYELAETAVEISFPISTSSESMMYAYETVNA